MTKGIYKQGDKWKAKVMLGGTRYTGIFLTVLAAEAWILECRAAFKLGKPIPPANGETAPNGASKLGTIRALAEHADSEFWTGNPDCRSASTLSRAAYLYVE